MRFVMGIMVGCIAVMVFAAIAGSVSRRNHIKEFFWGLLRFSTVWTVVSVGAVLVTSLINQLNT